MTSDVRNQPGLVMSARPIRDQESFPAQFDAPNAFAFHVRMAIYASRLCAILYVLLVVVTTRIRCVVTVVSGTCDPRKHSALVTSLTHSYYHTLHLTT